MWCVAHKLFIEYPKLTSDVRRGRRIEGGWEIHVESLPVGGGGLGGSGQTDRQETSCQSLILTVGAVSPARAHT